MSVAPDGRIATLSVDGTLTVWDPDTWEPVFELKGEMTRPVFSPDGEFVAAVQPQASDTPMGAGRTVGIWVAETGDLLRELPGEAGNVRAYAFSPDGTRLATTAHREHAHLWDVETGELVWSIPPGDDGPRMRSVAFHHEPIG